MLNRLFNATPDPSAQPPSQPAPTTPTQPQVGIFTAGQATLTFAGAPALVNIIAMVLGGMIPDWNGSKIVIGVVSLILGFFIYWQSATPTDTKGRITGLVYSLINSFVIAATALGYTEAADSFNVQVPPPTP